MASFRDTKDRVWPVEITVGSVKKVRTLLGVDLYRLVDDGCKPLQALLADPVLLVDVLYVLCKDHADAIKITDEQFGGSLGGDTLMHAADAFTEALTNFFPNPQVRENLRQMFAKSRTVHARLAREMGSRIGRLDPEAVADELIRNGLPGSSPASSASTPGPSPSAS